MRKNKELLKFKTEFQKLKRESEIMKDQYEAEMQTRLTKALTEEKNRIKLELEKTSGFKIAEKDILIDQLKTEIQNAQRRIDQSSQQLQGEAAEITIEKYLSDTYPMDEVKEYKKGEKGADTILTVRSQGGESTGKIIYESKRTKLFQKDWIEKFKSDMRKKNAVFGVLVTEVFPKGITKMSQVEEVWVCSFTEYQNLTMVLRQAVILMYELNSTQKNKGTKMELLHQFLVGPEFKNTVESILQSFSALKSDLDKEKTVLQGYWKAREIQLEKVLINTSEMYHSIRAIIGSKVPEIRQLNENHNQENLSDH